MSDDLQYKRFSPRSSIKHFYNRFKAERARFGSILQANTLEIGKNECEQYTSLLLNRLLFLYFLQQKGLLDDDKHYLSNRLTIVQFQQGPGAFYRSFLLPLFYERLEVSQQPILPQALFGNVPALGEGLFTRSVLEFVESRLNIPDEAFQQLFEFFDSYEWHLDETSEGEDGITPTALGHLFEQYVNQQQMGAYYTKKDVTIYIAQNTIIPHLFDGLAQYFLPGSQKRESIWRKLQEIPNRYIAKAIQCQEYLPTETTREYEARQKYYREIRERLVEGKITSIDDFITYNLNIQQFASDTIAAIKDPDVLCICYEQLKKMKILDPTCGSGAFLFAALHVLLPLYDACLDAFCAMPPSPLLQQPFTDLQHYPNRRYFILKSIIVNNLYGVDIMEDAAELCRLRLLLALLTQIERGDEIEPIPQIAQTIRVGNILTDLVGKEQLKAKHVSQSCSEAGSFWQVAFQDILCSGGFDIIIGNPPYVEYNEKTLSYTLNAFDTRICSNLYTCVVERSRQLLSPHGRHGMILPLAAFATKNMQPFLDAFRLWFPVSWLSFYHFRPSMLFSGGKTASIATAIYLARTTGTEQRFSTQLLKWPQEQRDLLFSRLTYCQITAPDDVQNRHYYPKFGAQQENGIMGKILEHEPVRNYLTQNSNQNTMYYRSAGGLYWKIFVNFMWPYDTTSNKQCFFQEDFDRDVFIALFNSSLFWWYYTVTFDTFNLKDYMLFGFRFSYPQDSVLLAALHTSSKQLMTDFRRHARHLQRRKTGSYTIYAGKSKAIIDDIDRLLAQHYGFTPEELDFILNYDIKYRMSTHNSTETFRGKE